MKRVIKYFLIVLGGIVLAGSIYFLVVYPPLMAANASKLMCSCVYVMERSPESVKKKEFMIYPSYLQPLLRTVRIEYPDSNSVTAKIMWATRKSIYREGLGCTLLAERSEAEVRKQQPSVVSSPLADQDTIPWPMGNRISEESLPAVNFQIVNEAIAQAFVEPDTEKLKNTLAVVVLYQGKILVEKYATGFDYNSKFMGWSMTKSLTNGLVGVLVKEGKLKLEAPAPVKGWESDERKNITLNDLMHASSGLDWGEGYYFPGDFHDMFTYSDDKGGFAAAKKLKFPIGEHWQYSSGTSNLISKIIRETVGENNYPRFAYEKFLWKIGMYHTLLELDASGTIVGSSYGYASARDWARFGLLFLNDGIWDGERILPEGWSKYSATPAPAAARGEYGAQFWLNAGAKNNPGNSYHPGIPHDEYGAEGNEEQLIFIIPSKKLVIVRLGVSHHGFDAVGLTQKIISALPEE